MKFGPISTGGCVALLAGCLTLAGCAKNTENTGASSGVDVSVTSRPSLAAQLPESIKSSGVLKIGVAPNYPPNEYVNASDKIVGWDIDLMDAVAATLGLKTEYENSRFDSIISGVTAGKYDVGVSSFTDTLERQKSVDFVDYFNAGTQWGSRKGQTVDPDNACGLRVAVQTSTSQATKDVPEKNAKCKADGKQPIKVQSYKSQAAASTAVMLGKADAFVADSPVTAYAVKQSDAKLQLAGGLYDAAPYGYAVAKEAPLAPVLKKALETLIEDGSYHEICVKWGAEAGEIDKPEINGAGG